MSLEQDLAALKSKGERLNDLRVANKTKLEGLDQEKNKLLKEAEDLGIAPDKIAEVLKTEEAAVQAEVTALDIELTKVLEQVNGLQ